MLRWHVTFSHLAKMLSFLASPASSTSHVPTLAATQQSSSMESSQEQQQRASQILAGYYRILDDELSRLWNSMPSPRLLVIVSPFGVREPSGWQRLWSTVSPESALVGRVDGAADGVLLLLGDNLRSGTLLDRSQLTDLAPTLLYALGAPVARDLDGSVLTQAFGTTFLNRMPLSFVPSYSSLARPRR